MGRLIVCDGNSLTRGAGASAGHEYPTLLAGLRPLDTIVNKGVDGQTTSDMIADYASDIAPLFVPGAIYVPWEIINAIYFGDTGAAAYSDYLALCQMAQMTGFVVISVPGSPARGDFPGGTLPPPQQTEWDSRILIANGSVESNWATFSSALYDVAIDPRFQDFNDLTYFKPDKVHYTDAGYAIVAAGVNAAINQALMPDTGRLVTGGLGAGAAKYVITDGFIPNGGSVGSVGLAVGVGSASGISNASVAAASGIGSAFGIGASTVAAVATAAGHATVRGDSGGGVGAGIGTSSLMLMGVGH